MNRTLALSCLLFITACGYSPGNAIALQKNTLTHKAYYWIGLNEKEDRSTLTDILGIDPVTTEWCAAFVNMVLLENDLPTSASVSKHPLTARSFLLLGEKVTKPKEGDILVFKRGSSGWQGHVGFYVSDITLDGERFFYVLGGNQDDEVSVTTYPASMLLGIRRLETN